MKKLYLDIRSMKTGNYTTEGFEYYPSFFSEEELSLLEPILLKFHDSWLKENAKAIDEGSINSHSLTASSYLDASEKQALFDFISQEKLTELIGFEDPKFLNTQLFFDPRNTEQKNYWHRDIQYTGFEEADQKEVIKTQNVVHFRIPLKYEPGIELVPGTHRRWDTEEEYAVRRSLNGQVPSDVLSTGTAIPLHRGDLLIFSANMIHRGLYGNERFTFDIIYCDNDPVILSYRDERNLPASNEAPALF